MIPLLRLAFALVLVVMTWGTVRASLEQALFDVPPEVYGNPWFQVTLLDAYLAFLTFYLWVAWRERTALRRALWFVAIVLWGNFAMASYVLAQLHRMPSDASLDDVVTSREEGSLWLPVAFVALGVVAYGIGAKNVLFGG